ncbi:hypothetical protein GIB67_006982 [Kingdonia uniflora]|uniref:Uncharacterized protein n=1 Tax=Kingdonia uniflora TaxID=39325 RepID=A0A7J7NZ48_9MAGN|nr:hypothetical protein GIB67_006982 [Kingdonia uniflora]
MVISSLNPKTPSHTRSISLPTRSHPLTLTVEEQIYRLRSSEATSSSPPSSSVYQNLSGLKDLYDRVDNLLQLPLTQQAVSCEGSDKCANNILDRSLRLLDVCDYSRDILSQTKEAMQDLQSSLRRRNSFSNDVDTYMISRKKVNKVILKCLADMKKSKFSLVLEKDPNLVAIIGVLREVEDITISTFESLLSFVSLPRVRSKTGGWSLVSKMMRSRHVSNQGEDAEICEMEKVDIYLSTFTSHKSCKAIDILNAQKQLEELESIIQCLESSLECMLSFNQSKPYEHLSMSSSKEARLLRRSILAQRRNCWSNILSQRKLPGSCLVKMKRCLADTLSASNTTSSIIVPAVDDIQQSNSLYVHNMPNDNKSTEKHHVKRKKQGHMNFPTTICFVNSTKETRLIRRSILAQRRNRQLDILSHTTLDHFQRSHRLLDKSK